MQLEFRTEQELLTFVMKNLLGFTEVTEILKCNKQELRDLIREGKLKPLFETARDILFWKKEVLRYLQIADEVKLLKCIKDNYGNDVKATRLELGMAIAGVACADCCRSAAADVDTCRLHMLQLADNEGEILGMVGQCPKCQHVYYIND